MPSHPSRTQFYSISDPIADLILIWNQTYIRPEILKNQTSRRIKDLLRLFLKYFPIKFNFEHSFWCIAIENHLLSSLTASILSQKQNIKSKWNRLFGLCVVLKVQKRTKADFFKQKQTHFRGYIYKRSAFRPRSDKSDPCGGTEYQNLNVKTQNVIDKSRRQRMSRKVEMLSLP